MPIFHIGYFKRLVNILQCVCKTCSSILLPENEKAIYKFRLQSKRLTFNKKVYIFKTFLQECKKNKVCLNPSCQAENGIVKKMVGVPTKVICFKNKELDFQDNQMMHFDSSFHIIKNSLIETTKQKQKFEEINPL